MKRKAGRPIMDKGNPFSPDVTPEQRRVMLRRAGNRESARRVRDRRNNELNMLAQKVSMSIVQSRVLHAGCNKAWSNCTSCPITSTQYPHPSSWQHAIIACHQLHRRTTWRTAMPYCAKSSRELMIMRSCCKGGWHKQRKTSLPWTVQMLGCPPLLHT